MAELSALEVKVDAKVAPFPSSTGCGLSISSATSVFVKLEVSRNTPQKWLFLVFCSIFEGIVIHAVQWKNRDRADCDRFEFSIFCGDAGMYLF